MARAIHSLMGKVKWLRGHPGMLLPKSQLDAYPGDDLNSPPVWLAFEARGEGYAGLVVHDTENTTFLPLEQGGLLAVLICADDWDAAPSELLEVLPGDGWQDLGFSYTTPDDESVFFDSVYPGAGLMEPEQLEEMEDMAVLPFEVALPKGRYAIAGISGFKCAPGAEWSLIRFTRVDSN